MKRTTAGLILITVLVLGAFFAFSKFNPFANPYEFQAVFENANNLKPRSPVRIAGVEVGVVKKVEPIHEGDGAARVTMELEDKGLPIHEDAELKIRPRIFLEGNFFVDLMPGSPSAPELEKGEEIPVSQTAAPVQFGDVLIALQKDTREDLQTLLQEYATKGLASDDFAGAKGFNRSIPYWEPAYKNSAIANEATLGQNPERDLNRLMRGQARLFAALNEDENALKGLVTNLNTTAAAFAAEDQALEATIPALRDTLRSANPALFSLNNALPSLRAFSRDALPGVRSSDETLAESLPFITQARLLMRPSELRGAAAQLRKQTPGLVRLNRRTVGFMKESRQLAQCTLTVLSPFMIGPIPDPDFPENSGQNFIQQANRGLVGLAGESRIGDGNNQFFHASAVPPPTQPGVALRPAPTPDGGSGALPHRPDVPCETQQPPNMNAPGASFAEIGAATPKVDPMAQARAWQRAYPLIAGVEKRNDRRLRRLGLLDTTATTGEEHIEDDEQEEQR